jgi:hypothetical protein
MANQARRARETTPETRQGAVCLDRRASRNANAGLAASDRMWRSEAARRGRRYWQPAERRRGDIKGRGPLAG